MDVEPAPADTRTTRWWPPGRRIDAIGVALLGAFALWVWWASRVQDGEGRPLIVLLLVCGVVAALARWATFFHGTGGPFLLLLALALTAPVLRDDAAAGPEATGALLAIATGVAALVVVRSGDLRARIGAGALTVLLAWATWDEGSLVAIATVVVVLVATVALLVLPMGERRWLMMWPALVAVLVVLGTVSYAALPLPGDTDLGLVDVERLEVWRTALDVATEEPLYGAGRGTLAGAGVSDDAGSGWAQHEPLQMAADTGLVGGLLLLALLWWVLAWVARPGGGPGSVVAGVVIAGSIVHATFVPIWHVPAVPIALAALAGVASLRGGDASWRLDELWARTTSRGDDGPAAVDGTGAVGVGDEEADGAEVADASTRADAPTGHLEHGSGSAGGGA